MAKAKKSTKPAPPPRATALLTCEQCKKPFYQRRPTQRFCSRKCRNLFNYHQHRAGPSSPENAAEMMVEIRRLAKIIRDQWNALDPNEQRHRLFTLLDLIEGEPNHK